MIFDCRMCSTIRTHRLKVGLRNFGVVADLMTKPSAIDRRSPELLETFGRNEVARSGDRPQRGGTSNLTKVPFPVEYKRGKRKKWDNDDVQLCAQALCLEEMLGVPVPKGAVFHIQSKRRREVVFTPQLRQLTIETSKRLHELIDSRITPRPIRKPQCKECSLIELCFPDLLERPNAGTSYQKLLFSPDWADDP